MELRGRRALLTGASGGIGEAIARALHDRGADLILSGRRREVLDKLASGLGGAVEVVTADLADRASVAQLIAAAGDVDVLVANAALPASGPLDSFSPEEIDRALDVNLRAPVQLTRALSPGMVERGRGHLVFISSMSGKAASPGSALYSATKFGLRGFSHGMREDLVGTGVGSTVVLPGFVSDAGLFAETGVELPRGTGTRSPEQVAAAVIKGIERDRTEIEVAPLPLRVGAWLAGPAPGLLGALQRRLGGRKLSDKIAAGQVSKR
jgi:short-subunit dehydrogenase